MPRMPASKLNSNDTSYSYFAPETLAFGGIAKASTLSQLPYSIKILLENLMRNLDKQLFEVDTIRDLTRWETKTNDTVKVLATGTASINLPEDNANFNPGRFIQHTLASGTLSPVLSIDNMLFPDIRVKSADSSISNLGLLNSLGILTIDDKAAPSKTPLQKYHPVEFQIPAITGVCLTGAADLSSKKLAQLILQQISNIFEQKPHLEFFGPALAKLSAQNRAYISTLSLEAGASCALFPIDAQTLKALNASLRQAVQDYAHAIGLWHDANQPTPKYQQQVNINLSDLIRSDE